MRTEIIWAGWLACAAWAGGAPDSSGRENLIENGGFETWSELTAVQARAENVLNLQLVPTNSTPAGWLPVRERVQDPARTVTIAQDTAIRHGGACSVRLENRDMRDISCVQYSTERFVRRADDPHNVRPNRRYLLRWWVRGADVNADGTGPILMMYCLSAQNGKTYRTSSGEHGATLPHGTFDWQRRQLVFITDAHAEWATFSFQLRWTTGTVWYDDVELIDQGPVVQVKTF
jgi:hypothetical protein